MISLVACILSQANKETQIAIDDWLEHKHTLICLAWNLHKDLIAIKYKQTALRSVLVFFSSLMEDKKFSAILWQTYPPIDVFLWLSF